MIAIPNIKSSAVRSNFLFGLGTHLACNGLLILTLYYLVVQISAHNARDLLGWVVPVAQGCCFFAAIALAFGLSLRHAGKSGEGAVLSKRWIADKVLQLKNLRRETTPTAVRRGPSQAEVDTALKLIKNVDWKAFKTLGMGYYRKVGFRIVDHPTRSQGIHFLLYTNSDYNPIGVRCLPWGTERVSLSDVRDFHRAMLLGGASQGVILTTGEFDEEALEFGEENGLELLGGQGFVRRLLLLPPDVARKLLSEAEGAERLRAATS